MPATNDDGRFIYPQAEYPVTLYHYTATRVPRRIHFHDVHGAAINPRIADEVRITIIATGFGKG